MKTVCKKLLCLMLVAMLLVSAVPAAFATDEICRHEEKELIEEKESTCTEKGFKKYRCLNEDCGQILTEELKLAEHNYEEADYVEETCTEDGEILYVCSECDDEYTETIDALGHDYEDGVCLNCGEDDPDYEKEEKEENNGSVVVTVYEVDVNNNVTQFPDKDNPKTINPDDYASTDAMVKAILKGIYSGEYSNYRYKDFGDGTAMLQVWTVETPDGDEVYQLKIQHNNGTNDRTFIDIYEGEGILAAIKDAAVKITYKGHRLVGYSFTMTGSSDGYINIYDTAEASMANASGVITIFADWEKKTDDDDDDEYTYGNDGGLNDYDEGDSIYDAVLKIYTNGKTSSYAKKLTSLGSYTKDGVLTRDEVEMIVEKYFKTNSDTKYYGLFTTETWNDGHYLTMNAEYSIKLDPDKTTTVYVMVKDATARVADSSNPKTGDTITVAVTTMVLAAAALVSVMELKKRKMI